MLPSFLKLGKNFCHTLISEELIMRVALNYQNDLV